MSVESRANKRDAAARAVERSEMWREAGRRLVRMPVVFWALCAVGAFVMLFSESLVDNLW